MPAEQKLVTSEVEASTSTSFSKDSTVDVINLLLRHQ